MDGKRKAIRRKNYNIIGEYVEKYINIYIVILGLVALFEVILMVRGLIIFDKWNRKRILYMSSYAFLFVMSSVMLAFLIYGKLKGFKRNVYALLVHIYSSAIILWAMSISYIDMLNSNPPIVYMTVVVTVAGVVILDPFVYGSYVITTLVLLIGLDSAEGFNYFKSSSEYINFFVFIIMAIVINIRHYFVSVNETTAQSRLLILSKTDVLTGLGNETAYIEAVEEMEKNNNKNYAVVVMDCNNIKTTNDTYGHRFGCHLIVKAGEILPTIFKTSRLFHIGGDEFVAIVEGDDLNHIDEIALSFDDLLGNKEIQYEGITLYLSVARGICVYKQGMLYREVFQNADEKMYKNKEEIKEKYGISSR